MSAYESDVEIIDGATNEALGKLGLEATAKERAPILSIASNQRKLSDWLKREGRESIASRLNGSEQQEKQLQKDISEFKQAIDQPRIHLGINKLRQYLGSELQHGVGPYDDDASIIDGLAKEELSKLGSGPASQSKKKSIRNIAAAQRRFSDWLRTAGRESIVSRINGDWHQRRSLDVDYQEFTNAKGNVGIGFKRLVQYVQVVEANRALGVAFPQQGVSLNSTSSWVRDLPTPPSDFAPGDWPTPQGPFGLAGWQELAGSSSTWSPRVPSDFDAAMWPTPERAPARSSDIYRGFDSFVVEANRVLGVELPQQRAGSNSTSTWVRDLPTPPSDFAPGDWPTPQGPFGLAGWQEPAGSSSTWSPRVPSDFDAAMWPTPERAPARSSDIYRGFDSFVDLPTTSQDTHDDARSAPVLSAAGRPPFFIGSSGMPQELEDIGHLVGDDWQHGSQPVPDFLLDVLDNKMLLPSWAMAPQPVSINGETYSITLGPRGRRDAQLIHHPRPSSAPHARIGASAASASSGDRSGRVLGASEWLGDEHIQRDYELLSQELRESNPNLAVRTRFVDPLMAFRVGQGTEMDALRAFHRIVDDRNGNDTADFLFLPVNDASATDLNRRGSHWSLLLVDRRDRDRLVAYHYDSAQGYNGRPAATLAARVGADLQNAPISQQRNTYDCGVFVVDGTRALVRRLAGRHQADLNLDNLVIDRQALQNRLKG
ncbi:Ulp1 family isopeptidase [Bradyrhizobium uaiense]|uniref:Ulp1 family isopeptidase n=1 Tax=Bradyrhizobium uaiense TaxID=2594946 RepID=UPI001F3BCA09|nr:Ulp1 family isopeptidase [Bradyrhizobium uaiense]